jgi:hypothetical protein
MMARGRSPARASGFIQRLGALAVRSTMRREAVGMRKQARVASLSCGEEA